MCFDTFKDKVHPVATEVKPLKVKWAVKESWRGWMWRAFGRLEKGRVAISVCRGLEDVNTCINDRS